MRKWWVLGMLIGGVGKAWGGAEMGVEAVGEYSWSGGVRTSLGGGRVGEIGGQSYHGRSVISWGGGGGVIWRGGVDYERAEYFGVGGMGMPGVLRGASVVVGVDFALGESWLMRVEAQPGFYGGGENFSGGDFNVPWTVGGAYVVSGDLQWVVGVSVDVNRWLAIFPGVGLRWKMGSDWVLNAVLPRPRLEYLVGKGRMLYTGAEVRGGTYRMGEGYGNGLGGAVVEMVEVRYGGGFSWKIEGGMEVELEGGAVVYRGMDFHRAGERFESRGLGGYGQVKVGVKF